MCIIIEPKDRNIFKAFDAYFQVAFQKGMPNYTPNNNRQECPP